MQEILNVEKCGICGMPFTFCLDNDLAGMVLTDYLVPEHFIVKSSNVLSITSALFPTAISLICVKCADKMDACKRNPKVAKPEIKWIHNFEEGIYKAYDVTQFPKMDQDTQKKVKSEIKASLMDSHAFLPSN